MKKTLLRKLLILTLSAIPAAAAVKMDAAAAETTIAPEAASEKADVQDEYPDKDIVEDDTEAQSDEEAQPQFEDETAMQPDAESQTQLEGETATQPDAESQTQLEDKTATQPGAETQPPLEDETVAQPGAETQTPSGLETPAETESENEAAGDTALLSAADSASQTESMESESFFDRIHYIRLADTNAASDSILIESNGHYGLVDASHPSSDPDPTISDYTADVDEVISYLHMVGVMHLDFILGTHSHSDHIGGMKFIAAALNNDGNHWVDSDTVYYYKNYHYNELEEGEWEWQNTRMFRQSIEAMASRGAILVETSAHNAEALTKANAVFVKGDNGPGSDSIRFSLGDFALSLFNLYHNSSSNENLNSIVTAVAKGDRTTLLMGDLETEGGYERKTADAVASEYQNADVIKVAHHGYDGCTSSDMLRTLQPSYIVTTCNRLRSFYDDEPPYNYYLSYHGITAYRAMESIKALVEELTGDDILFYTYDRSGNLTKPAVEWKARMTPGWKKWDRDDGTYDYVYVLEDGTAATGWRWLSRNGKTSWYLFSEDGLSLKGFQKVGEKTYYLNSKGEMQTGWVKTGGSWYYMNNSGAMQSGWQWIGGKWYYLSESGAMLIGWAKINGSWYYLSESGAMLTGWVKTGGKWYYLNGSGAMMTGWQWIGRKWYYLSESGAMVTGWQQIDGKWYYFYSSGALK